MSEKRVKYTEMQKTILYNQTNGICPRCQNLLYYRKDGTLYKSYEIAHIYPLNPTKHEEKILENEEKLFQNDRNELDNLIALCPSCHRYFDNPTTVESYKYLLNLKKRLLNQQSVYKLYSSENIEEELLNVINAMIDGLNEDLEELNYNLIKVEEKISSENKILSRKVKNDVTDYYIFIKKAFAEIDKTNLGVFNIIAGQIKMFYLKLKKVTNNQNDIYEYISQWLFEKFKIGNLESYRIIVSFFIQNCEVFENVTK